MAAAVSTGRQPGIGDNFIREHAFTMEELCAQLGKSRRTWYRLEAAGRTPPVIRVGAQRLPEV